jgi:chromate transport protein ChrA
VLSGLHISLRVLSVALLLWALMVVVWSYSSVYLLLLSTIAVAGAGTVVAGVWRFKRKPHRGAVMLTIGAGVCLVLLSWSPPSAIISLVLLITGIIFWGRNIGRSPPGGPIR